jgi:hypothetical protein
MVEMVSAQAASNGTKTAAADAAAIRAAANELNEQFYNYVFIILGALTMGMIIWRVTLESVKYMRTLVCLSNDTQRYFAVPSPSWASFKKNLLYAPIFRKRHNREFKLSAAVNVGTLPTRFQLLFLSAYFGTNVAFCVVSITWDQSYSVVAKQVRNRSGILAVVNMVGSLSLPFLIP